MKGKIQYFNFPQLILRTPLFPVNFLNSVLSDSSSDYLKLREVCSQKEIQEAIFLASPNLHEKLIKWLDGKLDDPKEETRLPYALMRYLLRMCTRCTPFGLFAGFSLCEWGEETKITFPPLSKYERHTRLDMNYLCALAMDLAKHDQIKEKLKFYPNSSIYQLGDQVRYVEYRYQNSNRTHHIVGVDDSEYLQRVLERAKTGATADELSDLLVDEEITKEEAIEFLQELIESQLLVSELEPSITGPEFLDQVLEVLGSIEEAAPIVKILENTRKRIQNIDASPIGKTQKDYIGIAEELKSLGTDYELKFLFQTDMVKPTQENSLRFRVAHHVMKGLEVMNKMSSAPSRTNLSQFKDAFYERYEDREVPLIQALDTESGVGYIQDGSNAGDVAPLVDDLILPGRQGSSELSWDGINSLMLKKYHQAIANGDQVAQLEDKDLESYEARWDDLPDTISVMAKILVEDTPEGPAERIIMEGAGGSSAANLLGRFCHADADTLEFVKSITDREAQLHSDAILAEIIHLPESRLGNILLRPILREYEIPYMAKSSVSQDHQIGLDDLFLSVRRNRLVLRSKRLNREIIPHLSTAHNYSMNALPIYHFLCDLQTQNIRSGVGFGWGPLANEYEFIPRMCYKNLILSHMSWNVQVEELKPLLKMKDNEALLKEIGDWRKKKRIPERVSLSDGDNKLMIDLTSIICVKTLFSVVKNRPSFKLTEFLWNRDNALVNEGDDYFTNEFVLSFFKKDITKESPNDKK